MVTFKESHTCWQFSSWNSPNLNHMPPQHLGETCDLPCLPASPFTANLAFPGYPVCDLPGSNMENQEAIDGFLKLPSLKGGFSYSARNLCSNDSQCSLPQKLGITAYPIAASCSPVKTFLIFDKSGNTTRLFLSPSFSHHNQLVVSEILACGNGSCEKHATQVDEHISVNPIPEKWDENHWTDDEGKMSEDTEEINALLFSGSEDGYDFDAADGETDEVTSTERTPFITEEGYHRDELFENLNKEIASSDGSPKRQKLLDFSYKKLDAESAMKIASSSSYNDDAESSCSRKINSYDDIRSSKREKKVKIRKALRILESIIPGSKNKDPLVILDRAIVYLKFMKMEAESLGFGSPNGKPGCIP